MSKNISKENKIFFILLILLIFSFFLFKDNLLNNEDDKSLLTTLNITSKYTKSPQIIPSEEAENIIKDVTSTTIKAIKFKNFLLLEKIIHPKYGVRLSPYPYILSNDIVFKKDTIKERFLDKYVYNWGKDQNNKDIKMTFKEYYRSKIYNHDYAISKDIKYNNMDLSNNIIDNSFNYYSKSIIVEYKVDTPNKKSSLLRLVYEEYKNKWYLSGIITVNG